MKATRYYQVAEHIFSVMTEPAHLTLMQNYEPFRCSDSGDAVFTLTIDSGEAPAYTEETRQEDEGQEIICGKTQDGRPVFEFRWWQQTAGFLVCSADYRKGCLITTGLHTKMAIDNALMVLYALATASKKTVLFHAAVVSYQGRGYMFLGPSGTGKSTHASLWLQHIGGSELLNDDNPVVRIGHQGQVIVYGSPWSGKTPCYRNVSYPLGAIVVLSQAPYNKIQRLSGIQAYVSLVASISGKRWDAPIADGLHWTENQLATNVPMWHLECLPNADAAQLCHSEVKNALDLGRFVPLGQRKVKSEKRKVKNGKDVIEEAIRLVDEGMSVVLPVNGYSMLPFIIGGKESVILEKPVEPKVGDIVLAWVDGSRYVVHRIIHINGSNVTLMGDGNIMGTEHCTLSDIKAVATHVVSADERIHDLNDQWRRRAARLWFWLRPIRRYILAIYRRL